MSSINRVSLDDTLNLLQLVRESALARSRQAQAGGEKQLTDKMNGLAGRLEPVMRGVKNLAETARTGDPMPAPAAGILGQSDFQKLLEARKTASVQQVQKNESVPAAASLTSTLERNRMIAAMASASMNEVEIARQFGMSREEVRLVLNVQQKSVSSSEVIK
jgi:hypothetical protein